MGKDNKPDGVRTYPADAADLASYTAASDALSRLSTPTLHDAGSGNDRLFVAAFDGTGNSMYKDAPENRSNVADIYLQLAERQAPGIGYGYVEGVGTQGGLAGTRDLITGYTYEARLEEMYVQFARTAKDWLDENPDADIRLASIGFSRGAEQAAGFTRLVHERGIQDPEGMVVTRDSKGLIESVAFTKPPLVEPGSIPQAVGLFDPVGTGEPRDHDRRLPPSVLSGFQISAEDERRNLFQSTRVLDPGVTDDGRFLNVTVGGAHSNIGGSYSLDGLSIRSGNLMADYVNSLSSEALLEKRAEPASPERNVVHRSEEHQFFYRTSVYDKAGTRGTVETLAPPELCRVDCLDAQPRDQAMAARFEFQPVAIAPTPRDPEAPAQAAGVPDAHSRLDGLLSGRIDPSVQASWDRDVAARAAELPGIDRGSPAAQPQRAPQPELVH